MAKSKKTKKGKEEVSTQDFNGYTQTVEEMLNEAVPDKVETSKTVSNEPPVLDMELAKRLTGHPAVFEENQQAALERLVDEGIAADFGVDGHARGFKWRGKVKR